jgi:hypothetical protein
MSPIHPAAAAYDVADDKLEGIAKDIERLQGTAILKIAERHAEARELFRYRRDEGGFAGWVETRLRFSRQTAYNLLHVHERFGDVESVKYLDTFPASILYLLAAPSTPEPVREEIIERAKTGEKITHAVVKKTIGKQPAAKRKANAAPEGNDADPQASADARKAEYAEHDGELAKKPKKAVEPDADEDDIGWQEEEVSDLVEEVLDGAPLTAKQAATFKKIKKRLKRYAREDAKREAQNEKYLNEYKATLGPFVARLIAAGMAHDLWRALTTRGPCGYREHYAIWLVPPLVDAIEEAVGVEALAAGDRACSAPVENAPPPDVAVLDDGIPECLRRVPKATAAA